MTPIAYTYNDRFEYAGECVLANPGALPPRNSTETPPELRQGYWPVWDSGAERWNQVEDHRGETGYLDGEWFRISELGPLPDGWSTTPPQPEDTRTPEEKRRDAYTAEADPILAQVEGYRAEAEVLRSHGEEDEAAEAEANVPALLEAYFAKKEEIRVRFPDE